MPYIAQSNRDALANYLEPLAESIFSAGELNYAITTLMLAYARRQGGNYDAFNATVGVAESAKLEFYRRHVAPYEDKKIQENGDVG